MFFDAGSQSQSIIVRVFDDSGLPVAGLNAAGMPVVKAAKAGAFAAVTIALVNLSAATDAWTEGGLWGYGDGTYRIDIPNSLLADPGRVTIWGEASGKRLEADTIQVGLLAAIAALITAIKSKTDNLPADPAAVGSQMDLVDTPNVAAIDELVAAIFAGGELDGFGLQEALRLILAALVGKISGLPTNEILTRAIDDSKVRITSNQDADGNITGITLDAS
ncbi:hypothetical protein [Schlesneria sp. DSM 10557]|uniref:hypothetical protein n=1 Tax=Schlesneria sp. DSM 10557 TaxID=3044399 RepID=UPI0035A1C60E